MLTIHASPREVRVELEAPAADARVALELVAGVAGVVDEGEGRYRLAVADGADVRRGVFAMAVERGWALLELTRRVPSLEDVFLRLTMRDTVGETAVEPSTEVADA